MSREIKAPRAWYKPLGVMVHPEQVELINYETKVIGINIVGRGYEQLRLSDFDLSHLIGTINEQEMSTGDIVEVACDCDCEYGCGHSATKYELVWHDRYLQYGFQRFDEFLPLDYFDENYVLKVGNRWEYPELIKEVQGHE